MKWIPAVLGTVLLAIVAASLWRRRGMLREFWLFLKAEKAWWLAPILIVLALVMGLLIAGASQPWLLFYPLF